METGVLAKIIPPLGTVQTANLLLKLIRQVCIIYVYIDRKKDR